MHAIPLTLFAKAPLAGKAKNRMCPPLTPDQAAKVAAGLLDHAGRGVETGWPGRCELCVTPDLSHPAFSRFKQSDRWQTGIQAETDLGGRMRAALQAGIDRAGCAGVLGTDIPAINTDILRQAHALMAAGEQVVGPSADGGFYFLGVRDISEALFDQIEWGSDAVYSKLLQNARAYGIALTALPQLSDCDYFEDLCRAAASVPPFSDALVRAGFDLALLKG